MATEAITVNGLTKVFVSKWLRRKTHAVNQISFSVPVGSVTAFLGPNGAGKSTTINAILGLLRPTAGTISIFGEPPECKTITHRVGFISEIHPVFRDWTVSNQLMYLGELSGLTGTHLRRRVEEVLSMMDLSSAVNNFGKTLSKGMCQRLGFAQALLHEPEILILDEPTTGLDPSGRSTFAEVIEKLKSEGRTIFFSTHILSDVERLCDRVIILDHGTIVHNEPVTREANHWRLMFHHPKDGLDLLLPNSSLKVSREDDSRTTVICTREQKDTLIRIAIERGIELLSLEKASVDIESIYQSIIKRSSQ